MRQLFTLDLKDYNPNAKKFYRPSVRGIILNKNGEVAMIYSLKWHFYKFPGGGMEGNETQLETLIREVREENWDEGYSGDGEGIWGSFKDSERRS